MRNNKGQFIHNKWKNWRIWVLSSSILACAVLANYGSVDRVYVAEKPQEQAFMVPVIVEPKEESIEEKFKRHFPKSHVTFLAIAKAESGLDHSQQNWNCWYNNDRTIVYPEKVKGSHSTSCKKEHRKYSWSIDCGVLMKNYIGVKECPEVDIDTHLAEMAELSKKRGFQPWYAWSNGSYKKFLASK